MPENLPGMAGIETLEFNDLGDVYDREFDSPVYVVVRDGSTNWCRNRDINIAADNMDLTNIVSLHILNPGVFSTSEDGKFLQATDLVGNLWVMDYLGDDAEVEVPDGVFGIQNRAFAENEHIKSVRLPDSIRTIETSAFISCESLEKINFPEGLTEIGAYAFQGTALREVEFPSSLTTIGEMTFMRCYDLESVIFRENSCLEYLDFLFPECEKLSKFVFPDHVKRINEYCFYDCPLAEIHLPATVANLAESTFQSAEDLYLESLPWNVIPSIVYPKMGNHRSGPYTFTIHYNNHVFVFPRLIDPDRIETAERMVKRSEKDLAPFQFAQDPAQEILAAYEAFRKYRFDGARRFLVKNGTYSVEIAGWTGDEELVRDMLEVYKSENMLTFEMLVEAKKICEKNDWVVLTAKVMELMNRVGRKEVSFKL